MQATGGNGADIGIVDVDESRRRRTLEALGPTLVAARSSEHDGDFLRARELVAQAAAAARDSDPTFAERLELRLEDLDRVLALHEEAAAAAAETAVMLDLLDGRSARVTGAEGSQLKIEAGGAPGLAAWTEVEAESLVRMATGMRLSGRATLGAASLLYRQEAQRAAEKVLARAVELDRSLKQEVDRVIAHGRGEPLDPRGYELRAEGFVSVAALQAEKQAQKVLSRIDAALKGKDAKVRDAIVQDALALGPGALGAVTARFQRMLEQQIELLDASPVRKQVEKLAAQRQQLDEARQTAKSLIYDEVRYFYPYNPPQVEPHRYAEYIRVQKEVDDLVAAVRALWNDDRLKVKAPAQFGEALSRLDWTASVLSELGELDPLAMVGVEWARSLEPGETIDIRSFCRTREELERRRHWQGILAYNERVTEGVEQGERDQLRITNAYRLMFGHRPLAVDVRVTVAARGHAQEMSKLGYFSHFSPTPGRKTPGERMLLAGYQQGAGENIALIDGAQAAHDAWARSSGHHRNLLNPDHTEAGVGNDGRYWVQNFGRGEEYKKQLSSAAPAKAPGKGK